MTTFCGCLCALLPGILVYIASLCDLFISTSLVLSITAWPYNAAVSSVPFHLDHTKRSSFSSVIVSAFQVKFTSTIFPINVCHPFILRYVCRQFILLRVCLFIIIHMQLCRLSYFFYLLINTRYVSLVECMISVIV